MSKVKGEKISTTFSWQDNKREMSVYYVRVMCYSTNTGWLIIISFLLQLS